MCGGVASSGAVGVVYVVVDVAVGAVGGVTIRW